MKNLIIPGILIFLSSLLSAIIVLYTKPRRRVHIIWSFFSISVALWGFGLFCGFLTSKESLSLLWGRFLNLAAVFIPLFFYHFVVCFTDKEKEKKKELLIFYILFIAYFFACLIFVNNFIPVVKPILIYKYYPVAGILYYPFPFLFGFLSSYGIFLLIKEWLVASAVKKNQIKYLFLGCFIGFAGGATSFPPVFGIKIYPLGIYLVPVYVLTVAYAIAKHHLMDINIVITKAFTYFGITFSNFLIFLMGIYLTDKFFLNLPLNNIYSLAHIVVFLLLLPIFIFLIPRAKVGAEVLIERAFFSKNIDYKKLIEEAPKKMDYLFDEIKIAETFLSIAKKASSASKLSFYLYDEIGRKYTLISSTGFEKKVEKSFKESSDLIQLLIKKKQVLIIEELKNEITIKSFIRVKKEIESLSAEVVIGFFAKENLLSFVTLNDKDSGDLYTDLDLTFLTILSNHTAKALEIVKLSKRLTSDKVFVGLGQASMRMAHDIRNPLVSIKTLLELIPYRFPEAFEMMRQEDHEFTDKFYKTALKDVDRINRLIERALYFTKHPDPKLMPIDINETLDRALISQTPRLQESNVIIEAEYTKNGIKINGDVDQLLEGIENIISNAIDAMEKKQDKKISIKTRENSKDVIIQISDTGCGIRKENIDNIFDPFITHKHTGSGLGLSIVKKIIEEHRGTINVVSELGKETSFIITLPKKK